MSPQDVPSQYQGFCLQNTFNVDISYSCFFHVYYYYFKSLDLHPKGGLLTLFLHSPLTAICVLGKIKEIPYHLWETGQAFVDRFLAEASRLLTRVKGIGTICFSLLLLLGWKI